MKLSIVIPARNEEGSLAGTVRGLVEALGAIDHEIVVVDDGSTDATAAVAASLPVTLVRNGPPHGFGLAVRRGLGAFTGDAVAVVMADGSDNPRDLVRFLAALGDRDCVFGTRWARESRVVDYPRAKYVANRLANRFIRWLFALPYDDVTNAFKLYRRAVIEGIAPLTSEGFELNVELPLKAVLAGYTYAVCPNDWTERKAGESKLRLAKMAPRYGRAIYAAFISRRNFSFAR